MCSECGPTRVKVRNRRGCFEYTCNTVVNEGARRNYRENPGAWKQRYRYADGRTIEERKALAEAQEHKCAICKRERPLVGDHCHSTGAARELICHQCNVILGMAQDDPEVLAAAIEYLNKHSG